MTKSSKTDELRHPCPSCQGPTQTLEYRGQLYAQCIRCGHWGEDTKLMGESHG